MIDQRRKLSLIAIVLTMMIGPIVGVTLGLIWRYDAKLSSSGYEWANDDYVQGVELGFTDFSLWQEYAPGKPLPAVCDTTRTTFAAKDCHDAIIRQVLKRLTKEQR